MEFLFLFYRYLPDQPPVFAGRLFIIPFKPDPLALFCSGFRSAYCTCGFMGRSRRTGAERTTYGESLCKMSFDLSSMERGELCHDRCMGLLLADYMQDIGADKPNARGTVARALDLRGSLTIQNLNKKKPKQDVISKISIQFCKISNYGTAS